MKDRLHYDNEILHTALIVDDEEINRELLGGILEEKYNLVFAADGQEALDILAERRKTISIVLLDLMMPKIDGFEVIRRVKENPLFSDIPIIVLTSERDAEVKSLDMGAVDFIPKPYDMPEIIISRVNRTIDLFEDRRIIESTERDRLTGLFARDFFFEYCAIMELYHPERAMDAVVLNIDHFHLINEIYGKTFGDDILIDLGKITKEFSNGREGIAGRGDGDTFYMYMNHQDSYDALLAALDEGILNKYQSNHIHIRIGICTKDPDDFETDHATLFDRAKTTCNTIRGKFTERIAYFDAKIQENIFFRERLIHDLHTALEERQFVPYFQPKYFIKGPNPVLKGAEALIRWQHPELGMVSPGAFISLFEENGLIQLVDHYIWQETARQAKKWKDEFGISIPISINVSRMDFYDADLETKIIALIEDNDLRYEDLHLEITESAYADNPDHIIEVVTRLREKGFIIEMDDFGTGYSSLGVLSSIPIDVLKIDMKFVRSMYDDKKNMRMIEIIMDIAKMLTVPVISEGVEDERQYKDLKEMGCDMIQGYYFSKPVPAEEFAGFIKEFKEKFVNKDLV